MRPIVLDNSIVLAWCLADEEHPAAEQAMGLAVEHGAVVPGIWRYELWNALLVNHRRGRLTEADARKTLADLAEMRFERDDDHDDARLLTLAKQWNLSAYDAAYLEVAVRRQLALASLDRRLVQAAAGVGVTALGG